MAPTLTMGTLLSALVWTRLSSVQAALSPAPSALSLRSSATHELSMVS